MYIRTMYYNYLCTIQCENVIIFSTYVAIHNYIRYTVTYIVQCVDESKKQLTKDNYT